MSAPFVLYLHEPFRKRTLVMPKREEDRIGNPLRVCVRLHLLAIEHRVIAQVATVESTGATRLLYAEERL